MYLRMRGPHLEIDVFYSVLFKIKCSYSLSYSLQGRPAEAPCELHAHGVSRDACAHLEEGLSRDMVGAS